MKRYEALASIANKINALNNTVKLKILTLLIEEGTKSITDISKDLNVNFSTAHKYLEQLERAELVTSKQVADNRLKRLFYVRDFAIDLSPKGLSELVSGKPKQKESTGTLKVINDHGETVLFNEKLFVQKYLKRGLPRGVITYALSSVLEQAYKGITLIEMRELFKRALIRRTENIQSTLLQLEKVQRHKRTYEHLLEVVHPEALEQHISGDIFISNLKEPRLSNFVHDLRGIAIHGIAGKQPKNLQDLFAQTLEVIKKISKFTSPKQGMDSFNYVIAPIIEITKTIGTATKIKDFLGTLNSLEIRFYIGIDIGLPKYATLYSAFFREKKSVYEKYKDTAAKIASETLKIIKSTNLPNIVPVIKIWDTQIKEKEIFSGLKEYYIANMTPDWQIKNASYVGSSRFHSKWRGIIRTARIGKVQDIALNIPRIALKAKKSEKVFFEELKKVIEDSLEFNFNIMELAVGEFLRKHNIFLKSVEGGRWIYPPIEDCSYALSIVGLNEAVYFLTGKNMAENPKLAEKILKFCNNHIKQYAKIPIRVSLKENRNKIVAERFYSLDSKKYKLKVKKYSTGILCDKPEISASFHKYLPGGHSIPIRTKKFNLRPFLKKDFGVLHIKT